MRGQRHTPATFTPGKDPVPILQEAGWAPGSVWTGEENLTPNAIRSPDRPVAVPTKLPGLPDWVRVVNILQLYRCFRKTVARSKCQLHHICKPVRSSVSMDQLGFHCNDLLCSVNKKNAFFQINVCAHPSSC